MVKVNNRGRTFGESFEIGLKMERLCKHRNIQRVFDFKKPLAVVFKCEECGDVIKQYITTIQMDEDDIESILMEEEEEVVV